MQKLIDTSTAYYGGGNAPTRKLFTVRSGPYSGRRIAIYSQSVNTIKFSFSDQPYTSWSTPESIATDAADYPISGWIDDDGNVYVAYTKQTTLELLFRKLSFTSGVWNVGPEVTIYNDKDNYFPSIIRDQSGKLTVCWTCYDLSTSEYRIRAKQSSNDGATWGTGPSDAGSALTNGSGGCYCQVVYLDAYIYCFYTDGGDTFACRRVPDGATLWAAEETLYNGNSLSDQFSIAVSETGFLIGAAFVADSRLWFMEYDTVNWSGAYKITSSFDTPPKVLFNGSLPYVLYGVSIGTNQVEVKYRYKNGSGFSAAETLHDQLGRFDKVLLYDVDGSPQFENLSVQAGDSTTVDVFHTNSNKLIAAVGDAVYLGSDEKFAICNIILSTPGDSNGAVSWSYYDGDDWVSFTPASGAYNLDQSSQLVRLWSDSTSAPAVWQKNSVDNKTKYWIRIIVTTAHTTAPVGTQITPLTVINYLNN